MTTMGKRGPPRTPTPQLQLVGSRLGNHRAKTEVRPRGRKQGTTRAPGRATTPATAAPPSRVPPPELVAIDPIAAGAWQKVHDQLSGIPGLLTAIDENALARYCIIYSQWVRATEFMRRHGETYPIKDSDGKVKCFAPFPQVTIEKSARSDLLRLEREFGLTPSARAGLEPTGAHDSPQAELLSFGARRRG